MMRTVVFIFVLWMLNGSARAQSQFELNEQEGAKTAKTYEKIKKTIEKLKTAPANNKDFVRQLTNSQTKWDKFVEAHLNSIFPIGANEDYHDRYGSIYPMCWAVYEGGIAQNRLDELNDWYKLPSLENSPKTTKAYTKVDQELNIIYQKVMHSQAKDLPYFTSKMTEAEKAWIAFRDADAEAYASSAKKQDARTLKLMQLTRERTKQLNKWIIGIEEGDCCGGSYPLKH